MEGQYLTGLSLSQCGIRLIADTVPYNVYLTYGPSDLRSPLLCFDYVRVPFEFHPVWKVELVEVSQRGGGKRGDGGEGVRAG